jgi:hypothetical protein
MIKTGPTMMKEKRIMFGKRPMVSRRPNKEPEKKSPTFKEQRVRSLEL